MNADQTKWRVEVVTFDGEVVKTLLYENERLAEKGDAGMNRNLDHGRFYTRIMPPEAK